MGEVENEVYDGLGGTNENFHEELRLALFEVQFQPIVQGFFDSLFCKFGKTNLLDAIYYMAMTKSAFATSDRFNFRHGTEEFSLAGTYLMENGTRSRFSMKMTAKGEKKVKRDDKAYQKVSEHIGALPVVMVSPFAT